MKIVLNVELRDQITGKKLSAKKESEVRDFIFADPKLKAKLEDKAIEIAYIAWNKVTEINNGKKSDIIEEKKGK